MNPRQRLLTALDGGEPDRVPCALGFYHVDLAQLAPRGWSWDGLLAVQFVRFPPSPEEEELRRLARPYRGDTRLGTMAQVTTYAHWDYRPETPDQRNPLAQARSLDDLRDFPFPDAGEPYRRRGAGPPGAGSFTRAAWPPAATCPTWAASCSRPPGGCAAWRTFCWTCIERPDWAHFLLDRLADLARRNAEALARAGVDVLALDDDVGMPRTMMISPHHWREFFKPRLARIIAAARAIKPDLRMLFHSDGYFEPIVGDLIEIGVNAINPLQPEHMDAARIRRQFGPRLALWGTVGRQTTFSFCHARTRSGRRSSAASRRWAAPVSSSARPTTSTSRTSPGTTSPPFWPCASSEYG